MTVQSVFVFSCCLEPRSHRMAEISDRTMGIPTGRNSGM